MRSFSLVALPPLSAAPADKFPQASVPQVRPPSRLLRSDRQRHDSRSISTKPEDAILVFICIHRTVSIHVDFEQAGQLNGQGRKSQGRPLDMGMRALVKKALT